MKAFKQIKIIALNVDYYPAITNVLQTTCNFTKEAATLALKSGEILFQENIIHFIANQLNEK